ncbi:hypothetical protein [Haloplasma contractile]|uniref:Uncharacterized protein n=1 Tax=Haloplasma contractile SSD-17B TaxID=1033810 RepID=U2FGX1_9MOLU|nr:hypothetical protein [Haloplasma contractile]ERJ12100.1 hypothetical protein HLPCO_002014 [Haloplasma contractile SSD-17B]
MGSNLESLFNKTLCDHAPIIEYSGDSKEGKQHEIRVTSIL